MRSKSYRYALAAISCSVLMILTSTPGVSAQSSGEGPIADLDGQTSVAKLKADKRSDSHRELPAPIVVELVDNAANSADDQQEARDKVTRQVQVRRLVNQQRRASALSQSTARDASDSSAVPRGHQTQNGMYVTYANVVPTAAKAAIQNAVGKWANAINVSTGPVEVEVTWSNFGGGILGSAGPETYISHGALPTSLWYPAAQANVLAGTDFNGAARPEIQVELNSAVNWYTGTSGQPSSNQIDLVSVVLHEVGHGMGFLGSARLINGTPQLLSPAFIFDRHVTHNGALLTNLTSGQSAALTSNNLRIKSSASTTAELYAPAVWQSGTSYSHFRAVGSQAASLMTPSLQAGTARRTIDSLTLSVLRLTGWSLKANTTPTTTCSVETPNGLFANAVATNATAAQVWRLYSAFYLRQPVATGFNYWRNTRDSGTPHGDISDYFASSPEFNNRYGSLNNGQFVDLVFNNVLCRTPVASGRNYWIGRLQNGMSRGDLMLFFSEGQEYLNKTGTNYPLVG